MKLFYFSGWFVETPTPLVVACDICSRRKNMYTVFDSFLSVQLLHDPSSMLSWGGDGDIRGDRDKHWQWRRRHASVVETSIEVYRAGLEGSDAGTIEENHAPRIRGMVEGHGRMVGRSGWLCARHEHWANSDKQIGCGRKKKSKRSTEILEETKDWIIYMQPE
jgi:hypothetical protein